MDDKLVTFLFELIKFDMQLIQKYGDSIINISIMSVAATFAISAFIYGKDCGFSINVKRRIIISTHIGILLILIIVGYFYINGLDSSATCLASREKSLSNYIDKKTINFESLYPKVIGTTIEERKLGLYLEKSPLYLSIIIIILKIPIELFLLNLFNKCPDGTMETLKNPKV